jgi:hypothetical protein
LIDAEMVRTVLLPHHAAAEWAVNRLRYGRGDGFSGNVIGLQVPVFPPPDLDKPVRLGRR